MSANTSVALYARVSSQRQAEDLTIDSQVAALRELGRDGVRDLVDSRCRLARRFADGLTAGGAEVVNDFAEFTVTCKAPPCVQVDIPCPPNASGADSVPQPLSTNCL